MMFCDVLQRVLRLFVSDRNERCDETRKVLCFAGVSVVSRLLKQGC